MHICKRHFVLCLITYFFNEFVTRRWTSCLSSSNNIAPRYPILLSVNFAEAISFKHSNCKIVKYMYTGLETKKFLWMVGPGNLIKKAILESFVSLNNQNKNRFKCIRKWNESKNKNIHYLTKVGRISQHMNVE